MVRGFLRQGWACGRRWRPPEAPAPTTAAERGDGSTGTAASDAAPRQPSPDSLVAATDPAKEIGGAGRSLAAATGDAAAGGAAPAGGDAFLQVLLCRQEGETWGLVWQANAHGERRFVVETVNPGSPAGRWAAERQELGLRSLVRGDELVSANAAAQYVEIRRELAVADRVLLRLLCTSCESPVPGLCARPNLSEQEIALQQLPEAWGSVVKRRQRSGGRGGQQAPRPLGDAKQRRSPPPISSPLAQLAHSGSLTPLVEVEDRCNLLAGFQGLDLLLPRSQQGSGQGAGDGGVCNSHCSSSSEYGDCASAKQSRGTKVSGKKLSDSGSDKHIGSGSEKQSGSDKPSSDSMYPSTEWEFPTFGDFLHPEAFLTSIGGHPQPFPVLPAATTAADLPPVAAAVAGPGPGHGGGLLPVVPAQQPQSAIVPARQAEDEGGPVLIMAGSSASALRAASAIGTVVAGGTLSVTGAGGQPACEVRRAVPLTSGQELTDGDRGRSTTLLLTPAQQPRWQGQCWRLGGLDESDGDAGAGPVATSLAATAAGSSKASRPSPGRCLKEDKREREPRAESAPPACKASLEFPISAADAGAGSFSGSDKASKPSLAGLTTVEGSVATLSSLPGSIRERPLRTCRAGRRVTAKRNKAAMRGVQQKDGAVPATSSSCGGIASNRAARADSAPPAFRHGFADLGGATAPATGDAATQAKQGSRRPWRRAGHKVRERREKRGHVGDLCAATAAAAAAAAAAASAAAAAAAVAGMGTGTAAAAAAAAADSAAAEAVNIAAGSASRDDDKTQGAKGDNFAQDEVFRETRQPTARSKAEAAAEREAAAGGDAGRGARRSYYPMRQVPGSSSGPGRGAAARCKAQPSEQRDDEGMIFEASGAPTSSKALAARRRHSSREKQPLQQRQVPLTETVPATAPLTAQELAKASRSNAAGSSTLAGGAARSAKADEDVEIGRWVLITGLVKSPQFNGQWGLIEAYDVDMRRYVVRVLLGSEGGAQPALAKLRRENFVLVAKELPKSALPGVTQIGATD
eukprot:TRINITY_DN22938_c0_g1_i1.p1 TRINITY_DN22938_c0_g1~~TRINITY_DN22938_c0_g1_i1.p1  ORF type:complete len:1031 (+),score=279.59 TRINITY_DN22938_c0_g1_i1:161-3253(+)